MPLVRIELPKGHDATFRRRVGEIIYESMLATVGVPKNDHFQVITEHSAESLIFDPGYLGIHRTHGFLIIQIFFNEGRTLEQKKALYKSIAEGLAGSLGVRPEDVFINIVEVKKENWSFGNGIAQYVS